MPAAAVRGALPIRGVHIDCRAQMLRPRRLQEVYRDLARWGFNTILFEYENRFPFRGRLRRIAAPDALTRNEIRGLNRLAEDLGLRIMPLVQCLGHLEYVLRLPAFRRLAEPKGDPFQSHARAMYAVCPSRRDPSALFREMAAQVLELHPDARHFHMGGDEVVLAARCPRCGPRLKREGVSQVLVEYYAGCAEWLRAQGPDPVLWGDLILAHPEQIAALRGRVVVMDWDYWSTERPGAGGHLWGMRGADPCRLATWPQPHRELFPEYILTADRKRVRPFPYTRFLRDHGFQVIVASAARSAGDNAYVPRPVHVENAMGAARTAVESCVLGSVITSWALRRAPWPLTEHTLMAGAMAMQDATISRRAVDAAFAREHFGAADPKLARIPILLGRAGHGLPYLQSNPGIDAKSGRWPHRGYDAAVKAAQADPQRFRVALRGVKRDVGAARRLLARARPRTPRQRERMRLWHWACDVLEQLAGFGPQLLRAPGEHEVQDLRGWRRRAAGLARETRQVLGRLHTPFAMLDEMQCRLGVQIDYIEDMLGAAKAVKRRV